MNVVREIQRINELELQHNIKYEASWHFKYAKSAYVFAAGLNYGLTEGDLICIFSQLRELELSTTLFLLTRLTTTCPNRYGEVVDCNLARDKQTGQSRGFAFIAYEDTRSCVVAVDNFNGAKVRTHLAPHRTMSLTTSEHSFFAGAGSCHALRSCSEL